MLKKLKTTTLVTVTGAVMTLGSGPVWALSATGSDSFISKNGWFGGCRMLSAYYPGTRDANGIIEIPSAGYRGPNSFNLGNIQVNTPLTLGDLAGCGAGGTVSNLFQDGANPPYANDNYVGLRFDHTDALGNTYRYEAAVEDVGGVTSNRVTKTLITPNAVPTANAGPDQVVTSAASVTLNGSASSDPNAGQTLTYAWAAPSGVTLSNATAASPSFTAPALAPGAPDVTLTFSLTVTDNLGLASTTADTVTITVVSGLSVVLTGGPAAITGTAPFNVTATFSKDVTGFDDLASDVTVTNGAVTGITGGPAAYTLEITPTGNGDVSISIPAAAANEARADSVVNSNAASNTLVIGNRTVDITEQQIRAFMLGRANQLASNQPGLTHFLMGERCGSLNAKATEKSGTANGCVTRGNTWADINGAWSGEGAYTLGTLGAHSVVNPNLLIGGMAQFDHADDPDNNTSGRGWMVGPYFVAKTPNQPLYFEGRLLYGRTSNEITPLQTYTDQFRTERWLAQARASGEYKIKSTTLIPLLDMIYTEDRQKTYTDSLGNAISSQTVDLMQLSVGLDFSTPITLNAAKFDLIGGIRGIYSLTHGATATPAFENWRGKAHLGLNHQMGAATTIRFGSFYDGLGTSYENYGANLSVYWKF
jgi:hypothetical protein